MPTNATVEYSVAEKRFHEATTMQEKIKALKEMLATCPKHKSSERMQANIKTRLAKLKAQQLEEGSRKKRGSSLSVKREGACQIVFIGAPSSGKSTLLSKLSKSEVKVGSYGFTTKQPEVRMIPFENIKMQGIEIPAIYPGFAKGEGSGSLLTIIKMADFAILVAKEPEEIQLVKKELEEAGIFLNSKARKERQGFDFYLPHKIVFWNRFDDSDLLKELWEEQGKVRVQTRVKGKVAEKPIILEQGATVMEVARTVHKELLKKFRYAKIWGPSARFPAQQVGLEHKLKDRDVVEVFLT